MTYHKGDIEIEIDFDSTDAREEDGYEQTYRFNGQKVILLPHSCNNWVIGGISEAETMIEDLKKAIEIYK